MCVHSDHSYKVIYLRVKRSLWHDESDRFVRKLITASHSDRSSRTTITRVWTGVIMFHVQGSLL